MSLYEQFHSEINKNYMFDMVKDLIFKEINIDISQDNTNYEYFNSTLEDIFANNDVEEITEINKILLEHHYQYFLNKLKPDEKNIQEEYEKLLQEREGSFNKDNEKEFDNSITDVNNIQLNNPEIVEKKVEPEIISEEVVKKKTKKERVYRTININSSHRTNINSSRFNYKVDLYKRSITSNELRSLSKIIIPIEENYLFSLPILNIQIPELDCNINMQRTNLIENNHRKYGIYESLENHQIHKKNVERITVDIRDITGKRYNTNDILTVNIIEIKDDVILFTCSNINQGDYQVNDYIKIINNNTYYFQQVLQNPLKIQGITDNIIICSLDGYFENGVYNNIDIKVMNMSNQNIIYFN